ncbi:sodium-independent sulfate anion transporter-like [Musca domestica]|uniref:Sodium-independent sulfate anion transporter-like n=1 Tax=Musca domestica TaxID=7370 RepID=A0ABM3UXB3_MUSDO|nr:sodium-independent sulfate anion transporter-like [Musca domestica]
MNTGHLDNAIDFNNVMMTDHQTVHHSRQSLADFSNSPHNESQRELLTNSKECRMFLDKVFSGKNLKRHMPIFQWLPVYNKADFIGDLIAGITVSLAAIPLALAFAGIAGLPTEFALYSSFMGNIIYTIFGSCKDNIVGSTAIASLLTLQVCHGNWQKSILFTLLSGLIELIMGLTRMGFIIDFVSGPVNAGFTSAVALIIFTSQIKNILVVKANGNSFLQNWISIIKDIHNFRTSDTILGIGSIIVLVILRYIGNIKLKAKENDDLSRIQKIGNTIFWFLGVSRNALLVFVTATIVGYLEHMGKSYVQLTGYIPSGFPPVEFPALSIVNGNGSYVSETELEENTQSFWMLLQEFGSGLVVIPLISLLETIAVCRTFANGKPVDTNQELISLGLANITNSFVRGYRINGGLARGSVNTASGGRTQFVNVYVSVIVILALLYLAEYFYYIPKATLAAIIIAAVLFQLQYQTIKPMWRSKKSDLFIGLLAFAACLVGPLSVGVFVAITINILYILYQSARPEINVDLVKTSSGKQFLKITPDRCLIFPSVEFVRNKIVKSGQKYTIPVVFDCTFIYAADFTTAKAIELIIQDFNSRNQKLIFFNLRPRLLKVFKTLKSPFIMCYSLNCIEKLLDDQSNGTFANGVSVHEVTEL